MHFLCIFSGQGRTKSFEVRMRWADAEAVDALAHAVGDCFHVEEQHS